MSRKVQTIEHHGRFKRSWNERYRKSLAGRRVKVYGIGRVHFRNIERALNNIPGAVRLTKPVDGLALWNLDSMMLLAKGRR